MASLFAAVGRVNNLHEPEPFINRPPVILGVVISFLALSTVGAIGRLAIRAYVTRNLGLDDLFVFLTMLANIAACTGVVVLTLEGGLGKHFLLLGGLDGMKKFFRIFYVCNALYPVTTTMIKFALLFQFLRILEHGSRLRTVVKVTIGVVSIWGATFSLLAFVPCLPIYAFWDFLVPEHTVTRYGFGTHHTETLVATFYGHAATNMFLDLVVFAIPVPLMLANNEGRKTRLALIGLFALGLVVNISSIFRMVTLVESRATTHPTFDPSWYGAAPIVLSVLECQVATLCASLPVFWPVVKDAWLLGGGRRILVTREVDIRREARRSAGAGAGHDLSAAGGSARSHGAWEKRGADHAAAVTHDISAHGRSVWSPSP